MRHTKVFLVKLLALLFAWCGSSIAEPVPKKFVVGLILPLSGELADYGAALRHGFELAQQDAPERFKHIELRYQDSQYDQKTALNAYRFLERQGDVNLYHTWGVSPNETILPLANKAGHPVLAETSMRSAAVGRPFVVRAARTGYDAAEKLVETFVTKGWKRVGLVVVQIPYYNDIVQALQEFGAKRGVSIDVFAEVATSESDFRTIVASAKAKSFDAFGPLLLLNQLLTFCEQANAVQFTQPMFGAHIHNSVEGMTKCLPMSEGALFPGQIVDAAFRDRYFKTYGSDVRLDSAAHSYETATIIAELFGTEESHGYSAQEILRRLRSVERAQSTVGSYRYQESDKGGQVIAFNEIVLEFRGGKVVPFKP